MPDYFSYEYDRLGENDEYRIDNPDRIITEPNEHADLINAIVDENAKSLFEILFPSTQKQKTLHEELLEDSVFGDIVYDVFMTGQICTIRFKRELTTEELEDLDTLVENHKNNV